MRVAICERHAGARWRHDACVLAVAAMLGFGTAHAQSEPPSGTPPSPDASCTVTAMNRTAPLQSDFSFTIYDIPGAATAVGAQNIGNTTPAPPFRVRAICSDGTVGETDLAFPEFGSTVVYTGPLYWRPVTPIPLALNVSADNPRLVGSGTTQVRTTGVLPNAATVDLTNRTAGTLYTSSNPLIATVNETGLVTAAALVASGSSAQVVVTAQNEGVAGTTVIQIGPRGRLAGRVTRADGLSPVSGAQVSIIRNQPRDTLGTVLADAGGNYMLEDVGAGTFTVSALDPATGDLGRGNTSIQGNGDTGTADIRLNGQGTLTVNVVNAANAPVANALVSFTSLSGFRDVRALQTDGAGRAVFERALAGQFTASTRDPSSNLVGTVLGDLLAGSSASVTLKLQPVGSIAGIVYAADGVTIQEGVQVRLVSAVRGIVTQSVTGPDGRFQFGSLPLSDSPYVLDAFRDGRLRGRVPGLILTAGGQQLVQNIVFGPVGTVVGAVLRSNGSPAQDVAVSLQSQVGQRFTFVTRTDAAGRYRIDAVPVGAFSLSVTGANGEAATAGGNVAADAQTVTVNVQLAANGLIGTVFQRDGITPVPAGVTVTLQPGNATTTTNAQGQYGFSITQPNRYEIQAADAQGNRGRTEVVLTTINPALPTVANVTFLGRGSVVGVVRDPNRVVQPGVAVELTSNSVFRGTFTTTADAQGAYRFDNVFVGDFSVFARNVATGLAGVGQGRIIGDGDVITADVTLAATGSVSGKVVAHDNVTVVPGAIVDLYINGARALTATADGSGNYAFPAVPLGDMRLEATRPADGDKGQTISRLTVLNEARIANIKLIGLGTLRVHAADTSGAPVGGVTVTVSTAGAFPTDQTAITDATGLAVVSRVFNGDFSVSGTKGAGVNLLSGSAVGTLLGGATQDVDLTLSSTPVGVLTGVVTKGLAAEPQSGVQVRLQLQPFGTDRTTVTGADGRYQFAQVEVGRDYRVTALVNNRVRARADVRLNAANETATRDLALLGVGTVSGIVSNSQSQPQSGIFITLTNSDPTYGGTWNATTQNDGSYHIADVPAGNFVIRARSGDGRLQSQGSGLVRFDADAVTLNLTVVDSAVTMPITLYDANGATFDLQGSGAIAQGAFSVFRGDNSANAQGNRLDIVVGDIAVPFQNGDGTVGRRTQAGQLIEVDEFNQASGLDVTRRIFVPKTGYFTRYLEILENRTANPITVSVRVTSNFQQGAGGTRVVDSSNSDNVLTVTDPSRDRWVVMDDDRDDDPFKSGNNPAVTYVFDGVEGDVLAGEVGTSTIGTATRMYWQWNSVTIPAGASTAFLHFTSQQLGRIPARATAERLVQLPPEALEGLTADERAIIRNFRMPADGLSSLQPLPTVEGNSISGTVYAGDGSTPIARANITFNNDSPYYPRTYEVEAGTPGSFTLQSRQLGTSGAIAIVRDSFKVFATHPTTAERTAVAPGQFAADQPSVTQDLIFVGTGNLRGTVRRHNGAIAGGGQVSIPYRRADGFNTILFATADGAGVFQFTGIRPGDYTVSVQQSHPQGQPIVGSLTPVAVSAAMTTAIELPLEPTGELSGVVRQANGEPAVDASVCLNPSPLCYRSTSTDTGGRYRLTDVKLGQVLVRARDNNNLTDERTVTVNVDAITVADLQLTGLGTIVVQVNYQRGAPAVNTQVWMNETSLQTTGGGGATSFAVPVGRPHFFRAIHRDNSQPSATGSATVVTNGGSETLTLTLPAAGSILGTVVRPDGSTLASGVRMTVLRQDGSGWQRTMNTNASGVYRFDGLIPARYTVSAADAATVRFADADATVVNDGDEITVNLRLADNRIALPATLQDANTFRFDVSQAGSIATGRTDYVTVFGSNGAARLEINGQAVSGDSSALLEAGRRQFAITQPAPVAGLNVTRKVFVPLGAYFARYLDILNNPTAAPITVAVRLSTTYSTTANVIGTSSGDTTLQSSDTWSVFDDSSDTDPMLTTSRPALGIVLGGIGAQFAHSGFTRATTSRIDADWATVTVPAGGRTILMHFLVQQVNRAGATAAVQRLQQLPPEALQSLTPEERAAIVNFVLPADGISTVAPLPSLLGRLSGVVYEGDGRTVVPQTNLEVRSIHPLFGRTYVRGFNFGCQFQNNLISLLATATGAYNLNGVLADVDSVALPVGSDVVVRAATTCTSPLGHPQSRAPSPDFVATIDPTSGAATRNVTFNSGILIGTILGPPDHSASSGQVQVALPNGSVTTGVDSSAAYRINGVLPGTYTLNATVFHNQGTSLLGSRSATAVVGQTTVTDIQIEPTGSVTGAVVTANGEAMPSASVQVTMSTPSRTVNRSTTTDSLGRFNLTAVPVGNYSLNVTDPRNGAITTVPIVVNHNVVTTRNVTMIGAGSVQLTVTHARGVPAVDSTVLLLSPAIGTSFRNVGRTDAQGRLNVLVPVGTYTLQARHPATSSVVREVNGTIAANNETQVVAATLPALANVRVTLLDRDVGNTAIQNASVFLTDASCAGCFRGSTDGSGRFLLTNVREGSYSIRLVAPDGRATSVGGQVDGSVDGQTVEKSASLSIGDYTLGALTFTTERQLYSFPATAGDVIRVAVNGFGANGGPSAFLVRAQVYDPGKTQRARGFGYDARNSYSQYNEFADLQNVVAGATGSYTLAISPYYDSNPEYLGGYRVQVRVNDQLVTLQPYTGGGAVTGTVVRADGTTPAADQLIDIATFDPLNLRTRVRTAADGTYSFSGVPLGQHRVAALDGAGTTTVVSANGALAAQGEVATHDLRIPPRSTLQVRVTIGAALTVPSQLSFTIVDVTGSRQAGPVSFASGERTSSVHTTDVYGDSITVRAVHPNNSIVATTATINGVDGAVVPVNLTLEAASLSGQVLSAQGSPVPSALVEVRYANGDYITGTYTDSEGRYQFSVVPSGEQLTVAAYDDAADVYQVARIVPRQGTAEVLDVQFAGVGTLIGRVLRENGSPASFVQVIAYYENDERFANRNSRFAQTDANGDYSIGGMPVGRSLDVQARLNTSFGDIIANGTATIATDGADARVDLTFDEANGTVSARLLGAGDHVVPGSCSFSLIVGDPSEGGPTGSIFGPCAGVVFENVPIGSATLLAYDSNDAFFFGPISLDVVEGPQVATIPVSVAKGVIRFADGGVATDVNIYAASGESAYFPSSFDGQGNYAVFGLPVGDFTVQAQDSESGLSAEVSSTLVDLATPVIVDITLPPSGSVTGTFLDAENRPVAFADVYLRSSTLELDRYAQTDESGNYVVDRVALGNITVLARDPNSGLVSTGTGILAAGQSPLRVDLAPPVTAQLQGIVVEADGATPVADALVIATTTASYGPFEMLSFQTGSDVSGAFSFPALPVGGLSLSAHSGPFVARSAVDLPAAGLSTQLQLGSDVGLPFTLRGADTSIYDVHCSGALVDGGFGSASDAYDVAYSLTIGSDFPFPCAQTAQARQGARELVIGPSVLQGVDASRRIYVPAAGGYARYLEVFQNTTAADITIPVMVRSNLGSDSGTQIIVSPASTGNRYAVTRDGGSDPALAHVFASSNPAVSGTFTFSGSDVLTYRWTLTVPAGQQVSLLHYAVQRARGDSNSAAAQAQALADGTQPGMFDGLSSADRASIRNFVVSP